MSPASRAQVVVTVPSRRETCVTAKGPRASRPRGETIVRAKRRPEASVVPVVRPTYESYFTPQPYGVDVVSPTASPASNASSAAAT